MDVVMNTDPLDYGSAPAAPCVGGGGCDQLCPLRPPPCPALKMPSRGVGGQWTGKEGSEECPAVTQRDDSHHLGVLIPPTERERERRGGEREERRREREEEWEEDDTGRRRWTETEGSNETGNEWDGQRESERETEGLQRCQNSGTGKWYSSGASVLESAAFMYRIRKTIVCGGWFTIKTTFSVHVLVFYIYIVSYCVNVLTVLVRPVAGSPRVMLGRDGEVYKDSLLRDPSLAANLWSREAWTNTSTEHCSKSYFKHIHKLTSINTNKQKVEPHPNYKWNSKPKC